MDPEDLLFSIDGVIGQCATAKIAYEATGATVVPVESIYASLVTLRLLVESAAARLAEAEAPDDGACRHPGDRTKRTDVGGGNWFIMCAACNEIIEQSGD